MKPARTALLAVLVGSLVIFACQDTPEVTAPSNALATVTHTMTVTGTGTGNGVVTSSPAGINCTITSGVAAATGCRAAFGDVFVTLTAKPKLGHSFTGWTQECTGLGTCRRRMNINRTATARFLKGPFTIKITGNTSGVGDGRVKTQTGLSPAIDCVITGGKPAATGCSATYPAYTNVTLTATPNTGFVFSGWPVPSCGTGSCTISVIQPQSVLAAFTRVPATSPSAMGRWDPAFTTPVVAVHVHLFPTGKVLFWGDRGEAQVWDPSNPAAGFVTVAKTFRIYCSGHVLLPNGKLLVAGGTTATTGGLRHATVFDPVTRSWSATSNMFQGRYYPTLTVLPNGEVLAVSGQDTTLAVVTIPEVWNGSTWRRLTSAPLSIPNPFYPDMFVAPNGRIFMAGFPRASAYLDVAGTGRWTTVANRNVADRTMGSAVMYAPGKILYAGGGDPPTAAAEVIDLNQGAPTWRTVPAMNFVRRQLNTTILADGSVLVTGGTSGAGFNNQTGTVHTAELWNPATETWKKMSAETRNRTYHATAILLPNGKVLSSGSGEGGGIPYANSEFTAQIFSPPYLFNGDGTLAARPTITTAPAQLSYGQSFTVQSPNASSVTKGMLIGLSSVTHTFNMSQRGYPVTFRPAGTNLLSATAPANANLAPPGPYMLFLVNNSGVPSVAKFVTIGP